MSLRLAKRNLTTDHLHRTLTRTMCVPHQSLPFFDYFMKEKIARGGIGTVYRAEDPRNRQSIAVKIRNSRVGSDFRLISDSNPYLL